MRRRSALIAVVLLTAVFSLSAFGQQSLDDYVGSYEVAPGVDIEISRSETQLFLRAPGQQKIPLQMEEDGTFSVRGANVRVVFSKDPKGLVTGFVLYQGANETKAAKKGAASADPNARNVEKEKTRKDILNAIEEIRGEPTGVDAFKLAELYYQAGDFRKAYNLIAPVPKTEAPSNEALTLAAQLAYLLGDYANAELLYKRLIDSGGGTMAKVNLLFTYYQANRFSEAAAIDFPKGVALPNLEQMRAFDETPYRIEWHNDERVSTIRFLMTDPLPVFTIEVNGVPITLLFDTGADQLILDNEIAEGLGIEWITKAMGSFGGGKQSEVGFGKVDKVRLGDVSLRQVPVTILPTKRFSEGFQDGRYTIGGIIGTAVMRQFLGTVDYRSGKLILRERTGSSAKRVREELKGSIAAEIPFVLKSTHLMMARGSLNGKQDLTFFVDSGLAGNAALSAPVQTLEYVGIPVPETSEDTDGIGGGGGTFASGSFPIASLGMGPLVQKDVTGSYGAMSRESYWSPGFIQDGLISHQFLRKYSSWTIDFDSMSYIFEK